MAIKISNFIGIASKVVQLITNTPVFDTWPEGRQGLVKLLNLDKPWILALPILGCLAVGGKQESAIPVAASWLTLMHAADLIDEVHDGEFNLALHLVNPGLALNPAALVWPAWLLELQQEQTPKRILMNWAILAWHWE